MTTPAAISALWLSVLIAVIAVPLNTIFGVGAALRPGPRQDAAGRAILDALIDLPFVVSPVIVGLALILVYGEGGWFGDWFLDHGIRIIYAVPGMVIATVFVSLPFVVREVAPVLRRGRRRAGAGGGDARRLVLADVLAGDAAVDPLGGGLRRRADHGAGAGRDRRGASWSPRTSPARR